MDLLTVPTIRFQIVYVVPVLAHERRRSFTSGLRASDGEMDDGFIEQVKAVGVKQVLSAPRSPFGTGERRECLDDVIIFKSVHVRISQHGFRWSVESEADLVSENHSPLHKLVRNALGRGVVCSWRFPIAA